MLRRFVSGFVPAVMVVALWGMTSPAPAAVSESSTFSTVPVLISGSLETLTTRPPSSGFEYALEQSRWEMSDWEIVRLIVQCESGGDRRAVGAAGEVGWLQVHPIHQFSGDLTDPSANLDAGFEVRERQGFRAWSCWEGAE